MHDPPEFELLADCRMERNRSSALYATKTSSIEIFGQYVTNIMVYPTNKQ